MSRLHAIELHVFLIVATLAVAALGWQAWFRGEQAKQVLADAHQGLPDVFAESRDVTIAMLMPCKPNKPETCGLIPAVKQVATNTGAQVAETGKLTDAAAKGIARASNDLHNTSVAAQGAVGSLKADLDAAKPAIVNLAALEAALTKDAATLQTTEKSLNDSIAPITANLEKLTFHTAGIAEDTHKVTHHFEQEIDSPKPKTFMQKVGVAWKIIWQAAMLAK